MKNLNVFLSDVTCKAKKLKVVVLSLTMLFGNMGVNTIFAEGPDNESLMVICEKRRELSEDLWLLRERIFNSAADEPINEILRIKVLNLEEEINALTYEEYSIYFNKNRQLENF